MIRHFQRNQYREALSKGNSFYPDIIHLLLLIHTEGIMLMFCRILVKILSASSTRILSVPLGSQLPSGFFL